MIENGLCAHQKLILRPSDTAHKKDQEPQCSFLSRCETVEQSRKSDKIGTLPENLQRTAIDGAAFIQILPSIFIDLVL